MSPERRRWPAPGGSAEAGRGAGGWIGLDAQLLAEGPTYRAAGVARYSRLLLEHLPEADRVLHFRAFVPPLAPGPEHPRLELRPSRLPTHQPLVRILWEQLALPRLLSGAALLHGLAFALPTACPVTGVVTFHDLSFLLFPTAFRRLRRWYLTLATRRAVRQAAAVIAVSESTRSDVIRLLGAAPQRVHTVPNGVEARFRPLPGDEVAAFRAARGLPAAFFLTVATLEPRKNLAILLEAYHRLRRRHPRAWPLLIGGAEGWLASPLRRRYQELGLEDRVRFLGYLQPEELPLWYNAASVFVYPSLYEGFGLPVLEAMACAVPVITSDVSSLPEVAGEAALLIAPQDAESVAAAMERLWQDQAQRAQLGRLGRERASGFSWHETARRTVAVYRHVLD